VKHAEQEPHINLGFAPFSDGIERPYFYSYTYPIPEGYQNAPLAAPGHWIQQPWQGSLMDYDEFLSLPVENREAHLKGHLQALYEHSRSLWG